MKPLVTFNYTLTFSLLDFNLMSIVKLEHVQL